MLKRRKPSLSVKFNGNSSYSLTSGVLHHIIIVDIPEAEAEAEAEAEEEEEEEEEAEEEEEEEEEEELSSIENH